MIAIYTDENSSPYSVCCLSVKEATKEALDEAIITNDYPKIFSNAEILFIQNEEIILQEFYDDLDDLDDEE
mgnify:CR=1 FL=1